MKLEVFGELQSWYLKGVQLDDFGDPGCKTILSGSAPDESEPTSGVQPVLERTYIYLNNRRYCSNDSVNPWPCTTIN